MKRINSFLSNAGFCSRRRADELIKQGAVYVNGVKAELNSKVSNEDKITVNGKSVTTTEKEYYLFHKPAGYVTSLSDKNNETIFDILSLKSRVFPIGRLDKDSEGLLLLTNDGDAFNAIMHPKAEVWKKYLVKTDRKLAYRDIKSLESGLSVRGTEFKPARCSIDKKGDFYISIREGKNRQIRKMMLSLGYKVRYLKRISVGKIYLGKLKRGEIRALDSEEVKYLQSL